MKLLYVETARSMWVFDLRLLNPSGLSVQQAIKKLEERYNFAKAPKHPLDLDQKNALAFQFGTFVNSAMKAISVTFTFYNNGITADTVSSTKDATEFLQDVSAWMAKEFGFVIPSGDSLKKGYLSQIGVQFDVPLIALNPKLAGFVEKISEEVRPIDGKPRQFDVGGINFWTEDVSQPLAPDVFRFERRWGLPFSSSHYFSQAPLETHEHIRMLGELEQLLIP